MQQCDRLKKLISARFLFLTLIIVIAAFRAVNKNISTGAVVRAKRGTEPGVHKLLANYQAVGYKFRPMIGWKGRIGSRRPSFMNSPKTRLKLNGQTQVLNSKYGLFSSFVRRYLESGTRYDQSYY